MKTDRRSNEASSQSGIHRLWTIAAFILALALITAASHVAGGATGRWARRNWALNPVLSPVSEGRFWGSNCGIESEEDKNNSTTEASLPARRIATSVNIRDGECHSPEQVTAIPARS